MGVAWAITGSVGDGRLRSRACDRWVCVVAAALLATGCGYRERTVSAADRRMCGRQASSHTPRPARRSTRTSSTPACTTSSTPSAAAARTAGLAEQASTRTQSFHSPSSRPWRRCTPTSANPAARCTARLAALVVKIRLVSLYMPRRSASSASASRPVADTVLRGKPAAVIGASTGLFGAVWAQAEVRKVLGAIGAEVVDRELPVMQAHAQIGARVRQPAQEEDLRSRLAGGERRVRRGHEQQGRRLEELRRSGSRGRERGPPDVAATARASTLRSTSRPMRASACGALAVGHAHHVLLDDRPGVELLGDVVRRGADDWRISELIRSPAPPRKQASGCWTNCSALPTVLAVR